MRNRISTFVLLMCIFFSFCNTAWSFIVLESALSYHLTLSPGDTITETVSIRNSDEEGVKDVKLYKSDYLSFADGKNSFLDPLTLSRSNANWVEMTRYSPVSVRAGEIEEIDVTITVPDDPELSGTYWSMIMVEPVERHDIKDDAPQMGMQLRSIWRYAVVVIVDIEGTGKPDLTILDKRLVENGAETVFQVDVKNTGSSVIAPKATIQCFSSIGEEVANIENASESRILPECSLRFKFDLSNIPAGKYTSVLLFEGTGEDVFGAQYEIDIPDS